MHRSSVMVSLYFLKVFIKEFFTFLYRLAALSCLIKRWRTVSLILWRLFNRMLLIIEILMHLTQRILIICYWWIQSWAHLASISSSGVNRGIWLKSALRRSIAIWWRLFLSAVKTRGTLLMVNSIHRQWKQIHLGAQLFWSTHLLVFDGGDTSHINFCVDIFVSAYWKLYFTENASIWITWAAVLIQNRHHLRIGSRTLQRMIPWQFGPWFLSRRCFQIIFGEKW